MKQYLLQLKSSDFIKSGNTWTSNPINLYVNSNYVNYSYTRSRYGSNLIGNNVYTGIEITSPSFSGDHSTPLSNNAIYKTDVGEVIYETATPSLIRFIDTSSRVDILAYRHTFTNVSGQEAPTFNIQIYESDQENGPWLKSKLAFDSNLIFIRNCKQWIKIELEIFTETNDTSDLGLLFYLEIGIHEITSPVISQNAKNILRRFPTWTQLFEDSEEDATPSIATPNTVGGKFLTSLVQDSIDQFVTKIDLQNLNNYIASANEDSLAWVYISYNVPVNLLSVYGDGIRLANVHDLSDFYKLKLTDDAYYFNPIDKQILTIKNYVSLTINGSLFEQSAINVYNEFDEFGARVGLPRLYLESNSRYKNRILDVYKNLPGTSKQSFQRTLRRELDIWKVYGATPDSEYIGATPEVIEIADMQQSTPYFTESGKPLKKFKNIVQDLNERYPSNFGYVRWDEGIWDYAGMENEGISRIPSIYDQDASPLGLLYQPGVGDFSDARLIIEAEEKSTISFDGYAEISGVYRSTNKTYYNPVKLDYSWYLTYEQKKPDPDAGKIKPGVSGDVGVGLVYEISTKPHAQYATPAAFYANLNYLNRQDFYVSNRYGQDHLSSPEFNLIKIFDQDAHTISSILFRNKLYNDPYNNPASPNSSAIPLSAISDVKVVFSNGGWNYLTQSYDKTLATVNYWASFDVTSPNQSLAINPPYTTSIQIASPNINLQNANIKIGSTVYAQKTVVLNTDILSSYVYLNEANNKFEQNVTTPNIYIDKLFNALIYPIDATPKYIYINAATPRGLTYYGSENIINNVRGGVVTDFTDNARYLVPSSPNILYTPRNSSGSPLNSLQYFNSATVNISSTPSYLAIQSASGNYYPLYKEQYFSFSQQTTPQLFRGFIDQLDNVYGNNDEYLLSYFNSDTFLSTIDLSRQSFNLNQNNTYTIKDINFISETDNIEIYVQDKNSLISDLNKTINENKNHTVELHAKKDTFALKENTTALHTGHLFLDEDEYYIYSDPVTETFVGRFFELKLSNTPTNGSPIIVNSSDNEYRNIVFEDAATPGKLSFKNKETLYGNFGSSLYLAYEDVSNVSVTDKFTGQQLFSNLSTTTNKLQCFSASTPAIIGREYEVTYEVNNAWYLDNYVYNSLTDSYDTMLYFSSTPNTSDIYTITYEKSINDFTKTIDLNINPSLNPLDEGYVYVSTNEYDFSYIEKYLSPGYISDLSSDLMYLSIVAYDKNNNLKPNQTFEITGNNILSVPNFITTNDNGLAKSIIRYTGPQPAVVDSEIINIKGIGSSTPSGNPASLTGGYIDNITYKIRRTEPNRIWLKAAPTDLIINADGVSTVGITGTILWNNKPFKHSVQLKWNKARTLKDLFAATNDTTFYSNTDGTFTITPAMTAQEVSIPGYWFARISIVDENYVANLLALDEQVVTANDVTISGDIIYWYESYDPIQYNNEIDIPLPNIYTVNKQQNSDLIATPNFVHSHTNPSILYSLRTTPNWNPPIWTKLNKYTQYQMGLFGSTPNAIEDYSKVHPDYEE